MVAGPVGQGADPGGGAGELGDEGVRDIDGPGEVADERAEELLAGAAGGPLGDGPKDGEFLNGCWRSLGGARRRSRRRRLGGVGHRTPSRDAAGKGRGRARPAKLVRGFLLILVGTRGETPEAGQVMLGRDWPFPLAWSFPPSARARPG